MAAAAEATCCCSTPRSRRRTCELAHRRGARHRATYVWRSPARLSATRRRCSGGRSARRAGRRATRVRRLLGLRVAQEGRLPQRAAAGGGGAADHPRDVRRPPPHGLADPPGDATGVHAARHSGSTGSRRASTFRRFHRQRTSCALAKGLTFELRHGMRVLRAHGTAGGRA
eukprot:4444612-Prymnesium_polylepis.2